MDKRIILFYNCCLLFSYFFFTFSHSAFCISKHYFKNPKNSIIYTQSHASFPSLLHLLFKILPHPTSKAPLTFPLHFFFFGSSLFLSLYPIFLFLGFCAFCWDLLHNGFLTRPLHWFQCPNLNLFHLSCRSLLWLRQAQIQNLSQKNVLGIRSCLCGQPFPASEKLREKLCLWKKDEFGAQQGVAACGVWWVWSRIDQCWPSIGSLLFQVQLLFSGGVGVLEHEFFKCCNGFDGEFGQWGEWIARQWNEVEENGVVGEEHIPCGSQLDQV